MIDDLETRLTAEYASALDVAVPPSAVDLDRARTRGRRRRRARQTLTLGSAFGAAGLAALLVVTLLPAAPAGPSARQSTGAQQIPGPVPAHDPMAASVTFGYLPDGVRLIGAAAGYGTHPASHLTAGGAGWTFLAAPLADTSGRGQADPPSCFEDRSNPCKFVGPFIGGRPADWMVPSSSAIGIRLAWNPQGTLTVAFRNAAGQMILMTAHAPNDKPTAAQMAVIVTVAEHISLGRYRPLQMPFHVPQPPPGWKVQSADWGEIAGDLTSDSAGIAFQKGPADLIVVEVRKTGTPGAWTPEIATISGGGPSETLTKQNVNGYDVHISVTGSQARAVMKAAGGMEGYYRSLTIHSTDPSTWTTDVVG